MSLYLCQETSLGQCDRLKVNGTVPAISLLTVEWGVLMPTVIISKCDSLRLIDK